MFEKMTVRNAKEHIYAAAFALVLILIVSCSAYADRIELKNGQVFEGDIIGEEDERIQLKLDGSGARLWFSRDRILSIEKSSPPKDGSAEENILTTPAVEVEDDEARAQKLLDDLRKQPAVAEKETGVPASPFIGNESAAVTIEVFTDYQ